MLLHQTVDKLQSLKLLGMAKALAEQMAQSDIDSLSFDERLGFFSVSLPIFLGLQSDSHKKTSP